MGVIGLTTVTIFSLWTTVLCFIFFLIGSIPQVNFNKYFRLKVTLLYNKSGGQ